jgi:hypothetical protein
MAALRRFQSFPRQAAILVTSRSFISTSASARRSSFRRLTRWQLIVLATAWLILRVVLPYLRSHAPPSRPPAAEPLSGCKRYSRNLISRIPKRYRSTRSTASPAGRDLWENAMSFETPLPRDHANDAACRSHGDDVVHRGHSRLQRDRRPLGLDAAISWVIALFIEGLTAYGAAMWPDILAHTIPGEEPRKKPPCPRT